MIMLEVSPEAIEPTIGLTLGTTSSSLENNGDKTFVQTAPSGEILGWAKQEANPKHLVRFYHGKGGFCVVVSSENLIYFGLPGSRILLPDTEVELPGPKISGKPAGMIHPKTDLPPQTVTHQAMILGAGLATRFEPVSGDTTGYSKPAVPICGEDAVITAIAKLLHRHGFSRILINTFYKPDCLKQQLDYLPEETEIVYIDEEAPSGTAGGLAKAFEQGLVDREKPILIIQGDAVTDADLSFLMKMHIERKAMVTIGGQIVGDEEVHKFGIIETDGAGEDGQSGNITSFKEKPSLQEAGISRFANAGFYILSPEVFDLFMAVGRKHLKNQALYDYAKDFFPAVLAKTQEQHIANDGMQKSSGFWAQALGGYWSDIGTPSQYIEALRDVYAGKLAIDRSKDLQNYYDSGIIYWPGTKYLAIQDQASLYGNVIVAKACAST